MRHPLPPTFACVAAMALVAIAPAHAKGAKETYVFEVTNIDNAAKAPKSMVASVKSELAKAIETNPRLVAALSADAPDPKASPKKFKAYLQRKKMRAFKVSVEISEYSSSSEAAENGKGTELSVRVALHMFGETVPDRVMAFTGDGSAGIKLSLGKVVRDNDRDYANEEAAKESVNSAVEASMQKLDAPPAKKRKRKK